MMIGFHFYKAYGGLVYPPTIWGLELFGLFMLAVVQLVRVYYGFQANRSENQRASCIFLMLTIMSMFVIIHFSFLTTYVLMVEIILSAIILVLSFLELIQSSIALKRFGQN